jgi:hypothetical protein
VSVSNLIASLVSNLPDPALRMDVASTIKYLFDIYSSGRVKDEEIKQSLYEVCREVISATSVNLLPEEIQKLANEKAEEFLKAFRLESISRRVSAKFRPSVF